MPPSDPPADLTDPPCSPRPRSRRAVLAAVGTATASGLAGCSALEDDPDPLHPGDWREFGNGTANANRVDGGAPAPDDGDVIVAAGWPYAPPVVVAGVVYVAADRTVTAVTPDGDQRWSRRLDRKVSGAPAVDPLSGHLYVPTRTVPTADATDPVPASVTVLSLAGGTVVDTYRVGEDRTYGVTLAGSDVVARSATACVRVAPDGTERWRRPLASLAYEAYNLGDDTATQVAPAVTDDGVYVPDSDALVKLDPDTGEERRRVAVDTPYAASVVAGDAVVQTGLQETVAVDRSGDVRWRRDLGTIAAAAAGDGALYVAAGALHELDAATGETNWQASISNDGSAAPVVTDDSVLVASGDVRAVRREAGGTLGPDRARWRRDRYHASAYASPVVAAGHVLVVGPTGLAALAPPDEG
jgi:hypothetical protein